MCDEKLVKKYGWVFVGFTIFLITVTPFLAQVYVFHPFFSYHFYDYEWLWVGPFHLSVLSIWINYYLGCVSDPGATPRNYDPVKKEATKQKPRWCKDCLAYKPPRAHHCSVCNKCILRMDHHCPWLNNCIGHKNHPHFLRFLGSVTFASMYGVALISMRIWYVIAYQNQMNSYFRGQADYKFNVHYTPVFTDVQIFSLLYVVIVFFALLFTVGILYLWQLWYVSRNVSTIESFEMNTIDDMKRRGQIPKEKRFPYDLGVYRNFKAMFGDNILFWWFPKAAKGDGVKYDVDPEVKNEWPPREYYLYKKYPNGKPSKADQAELRRFKHHRKGSEGYLVKQLTPEEREALVNNPPKDQEIEEEFVSSTDYDSLYSEEEVEEDSDEESLMARQRRIIKTE
ncbi:Palmitoyltransferase [Boothiomyces sp. JEL0866]|nr:Palmitoyltransferase [Boothiomyces sp. JEL0866]